MRHAITKLSHIHLVANEDARVRVEQLGEESNRVKVIGSPEVDVMFSDELPSLDEVKSRYDFPPGDYVLYVMHPVVTEDPAILAKISRRILHELLVQHQTNVIALLPNNDVGADRLRSTLDDFRDFPNFRLLPSMRFEYYLTALRNAKAIVGNSSSGVREAPAFGTPSLNVGSRQYRRAEASSIFNLASLASHKDLLDAVERSITAGRQPIEQAFGVGNSARLFEELLLSGELYSIPLQKEFQD
jgi:UDP-N-acetylglucosamine 2-epimerase (hydrolysing)